MEVPESIDKLTTTVSPDSFIPRPAVMNNSFDDIINVIRQRVDLSNYKYFEEGLTVFKQNINADKNFLKNLLNIYNTAVINSINSSSISDEHKQSVIKAYKNVINGQSATIEAVHELANSLNKNENIIDVQRISYIILGYVIDTINKLNQTRK